MKNIFLFITVTLLISCCSKKEDLPQNPVDQLPPPTQIGANTAGGLVNGQVFLPKGNSFGGPILSCFYQQDIDGYHLGLSIINKSTQENKSINISLNPNFLTQNTTYLLGKITDNGSSYTSNFGEYIVTSNIANAILYSTNEILVGEIKINKLNTAQRIIAGTFWYDAINPQGEVVKVRDGRFDMRYVN